ncbi:MAG TPA: hypothetical protein VIW68_09300 [Candidatus Sulfotelmatobacter sp.]
MQTRAAERAEIQFNGVDESFSGKTKLGNSGPGFMILVNDITEMKTPAADHLLLVPREGKSFVSAMDLPEAGVTLHFGVPSETRQVTLADKTPATTAR